LIDLSYIVRILEILDKLPEPLRSLFTVLGIIFAIYLILKVLMKLFRSVENAIRYVKLKVYYPLASHLVKRKHKEYVREFLKSLVSKRPVAPGLGIEYDVDVEWSSEEGVLLDLERGVLLVRIPYTTNLNQVIAKTLLMASPYAVSQYLEPVFGPKLAQLLSISIAREYASRDVNVLKEFMQYVQEVYEENEEFRKLIEYINRADDESLYKHIVLYELKRVLEEYDGHVDRDKLEEDVKKLIEVVGTLHEISAPIVCGHYVSITIVRVGKLEKVLLEEWSRYVNYIRMCMQKCSTLRRVYVVSAGKFIKEIAKKFIDYVTSNVSGLKLLNQVSYRARYYKGKPGVTQYVAVFEVE